MPSTTVHITYLTPVSSAVILFPLNYLWVDTWHIYGGQRTPCYGRAYLRVSCCCHLGQLALWLLGSSPVPTPHLTVMTDVCHCIRLLMGVQGPEPRYEICAASAFTCCATLLVLTAIILYRGNTDLERLCSLDKIIQADLGLKSQTDPQTVIFLSSSGT